MKQIIVSCAIPLILLESCQGFAPLRTRAPQLLEKVSNNVNENGYDSFQRTGINTKLYATENDGLDSESRRSISAAPMQMDQIEIKPSSTTTKTKPSTTDAKTNTVNERLIAELNAATEAERGPKTKMGEKFKGSFQYSNKTDEERQMALEAARDLNGVNPTVTILASFFAFGMAIGLWSFTQFLAEVFLTHPMGADAPYAFTRIASVFRNAIMGLVSLASGFSFVSGLGVFLLGVRVAYGVFTGELDPTPIKKIGIKANDNAKLPNALDLMMGKKPGRKRKR
uniref:Uncharacterized protein n=1 Tax=Chaetoceros debilis TaxID=122233 RepID=A0A7S3PZT6_9STRA